MRLSIITSQFNRYARSKFSQINTCLNSVSLAEVITRVFLYILLFCCLKRFVESRVLLANRSEFPYH